MRKLLVEGCEYKTVHQDLLRDLLRLSTSTYSQVRSKAQNVLFTALGTYNFCCRDITPRVLELLKPTRTDVTQQQFKVNISLLFSYILASALCIYFILCCHL